MRPSRYAFLTVPIALVIGAALIAASVLITFRYEVALSTGQIPVARLDRWTGDVVVCNVRRDPAPGVSAPATGLYDVAAARKAGYSNAKIADFLAPRIGFDLARARAAEARSGLTPAEADTRIVDFLATQPIAPAPKLSLQTFAAGSPYERHTRKDGDPIPMNCTAH